MKRSENSQHFTSAIGNAKLVRAIAVLVRRARLDYEGFRRVSALVRKEVGIRRPLRSRRLPHILSDAEFKRFYETIDQAGNLQHQIMLRLLFYTAVRVSELISIRVEDVDLDDRKVFIELGKGSKDRYTCSRSPFGLILKAHLAANPDNRYLFESRQRTKYTARRVQPNRGGVCGGSGSVRAHPPPHLLRHQMLTWLTAHGLQDSQIQLISGHASKKSLEVYHHLSLAQVERGYQSAVRGLDI